MHLETGPHSILYNSPFVCFSAVRLRRAEAWQYKQSPSSQAAASAANLRVMTKQQTSIRSARYSTSCLAFRKPEQCVWGGLGSSGNACLCHLAQTRALLFPGAGQTPHAALLPARTGSCQAEPSPCPRSGNISQVEGNKPAIRSRAEECSQLASSLFLGSDEHQHPVGGRLQGAARTMPGWNQRVKVPLQKTA